MLRVPVSFPFDLVILRIGKDLLLECLSAYRGIDCQQN
jgi:hypothetical protein